VLVLEWKEGEIRTHDSRSGHGGGGEDRGDDGGELHGGGEVVVW
jgi:hypothetical protein